MGSALNWLPVAAAVFAVPQFLPQLSRVGRTGDTAGVSWSWAALTSVSNGGWIAYFALSRFWTALVPATSACVLAGALAVRLGRRDGVPLRPAALTAGWSALLALAWATSGRAGLGTALAASFVLQVTPSVWTAYRADRPTGISPATWLLILAELLCWGVYGLHKSDPRLTALGATGVIASVLMLARARSAAAAHHVNTTSSPRAHVREASARSRTSRSDSSDGLLRRTDEACWSWRAARGVAGEEQAHGAIGGAAQGGATGGAVAASEPRVVQRDRHDPRVELRSRQLGVVD